MKRFLSTFLCLCFFFLSGCKHVPDVSSDNPLSKSGIFFDTIVTIKLYDSNDISLIEGCFSLCREYENKLSRTIPTSEIAKVNASKGNPVTVSAETAQLIEKGLYYSNLSDGAFDITVAPVTELWNFGENKGDIPSPDDIATNLQHVSYENVLLDGNQVTLKDPFSALDLGGIAKGYIADRIKDYLIENGVKHAVIYLGGNVQTIGGKTDDIPFSIGIQKPFSKQNDTLLSLSITDKSVVSSGIYERYFEKDGKIYHHILNPKTGYPYENELFHVTIVTDSSVDCDALSTVCYALGLEKGIALINSLPDTEAIFVTNDNKTHFSENIEDIIIR